MNSENIILSRNGAVATVTLNRPNAANAMNLALLSELADRMLVIDEDPSIRAVVLTGAGRMFCAGGDLQSFANDLSSLPARLKELTLHLHAAVSRMARMNAPIIGAVNGPAAGAGMSLAAACDIVLASEAASFTMAYTAAGLSPDGSASWFLPRRIGQHRTRELMLTNRRLTASEAEAWGLANRVVPAEELIPEAVKLADSLATGPTRAFGTIKTLLARTFETSLETQMELEARAIAESARSDDAKEGISAFLEKRKPDFKGR